MYKELKRKYLQTFEIVRNELNRLDPVHLRPSEFCPIDEYDLETEMVLTKLKKNIDHIRLSKEMARIFNAMFFNHFSESLFYDCAQNILEQVKI